MAPTVVILPDVSGKLPADRGMAPCDNIKSEAISLRPTHHSRTIGELATSLISLRDSNPDPADLPYRAIQVGTQRQLITTVTIHFIDECIFRILTGKYGPPDGPQDILIIGDIVNGPDNFHVFPEVQTVALDNEILISAAWTHHLSCTREHQSPRPFFYLTTQNRFL
ncbi:hypothetical protein TURU_112077 [Turdus rufiventris]|nr:hypothetical protein TURU_112077 [Turdus rufiventris]